MARGKGDKKVIKLNIDGKGSATTLKELHADARKLKAVLANINPDDKNKIQEYKNKLDQVKAATQKVGEETGLIKKKIDHANQSMGKFGTAVNKVGGFMKTAFKATGIILLVDKILEVVQGLGLIGIESVKARRDVRLLFSESGEDIDALTAKSITLANAMGEDTKTAAGAAKVAYEAFGGSAGKILDELLLTSNLLVDSQGEFLDVVQEFSPKIAEAGGSFEDFMGTLIRAERAGARNLDVVADLYQEAGQRLRDPTDATKEAITSLGKDFKEKLFDEIDKGSLKTGDAMVRITKRMNELNIGATATQKIISDVFGSQGEELTINFLKNLENIEGGFEDLIASADYYTQAQIKMQKDQEQFNLIITKVSDKIVNFLSELYVKSEPVIQIFKALGKQVYQLYQELSNLVDQLEIFGENTSAVDVIVKVLTGTFKVLTFTISAILKVFRGLINGFITIYNNVEIVRGGLHALASTFKSVFSDIKKTLLEAKDGISEVIEGIFTLDQAKIKSGYEKLSGSLVENYTNLGKNAAAAFQSGYQFGAGNQIDLLGAGEDFGANSSVSTNKTDINQDKKTPAGGGIVSGYKKDEILKVKESQAELLKLEEDFGKKVLEIRKKTEEEKKKMEYDALVAHQNLTQEKEEAAAQLAIKGTETAINATLEYLTADEELRKKHFEKIKAAHIVGINAEVASEIAGIWKNANTNPINAILPGSGAVIAGLETAAALARANNAIKKVNSQKLAKGGELKGPAHSQGGIQGWGGFGHIEAEGGEFMVNKHAYANNQDIIKTINQAGKYSRFGLVKMATGGPLPVANTTPSNEAITAVSQHNNQETLEMSRMMIKELAGLRKDINDFEREKEIYLNTLKLEDQLTKNAKIRNY
ncbi:phage tail tape measure protein [Flexithrix dorotheae]|uniref:phage tail tape measure protein n=1 Tax=Flexithrix dorotheae TaxID=70993 RepID=UPI00037CED96|nr:phage tail tape measure protein [Flexithrix dorotheae]